MADVSIFAVDPGTTSGVARGIFPMNASGVWDGLETGDWESWEVNGEPKFQAWEIMLEYEEWSGAPTFSKFKKKGIIKRIFVVEDFVVRLGTGPSSKSDLLDPVRVAEGIITLSVNRKGLIWCQITRQQPSHAKNFATNDRLRKHGLWVKGSEHRRDAVRHMATAYAGVLKRG